MRTDLDSPIPAKARRSVANRDSVLDRDSAAITRSLAASPKRAAPKHVARNRVDVIEIPAWRRYPWLLHGFSTRTGGRTRVYRPGQRAGELNLGFTASDPADTVSCNRAIFLEALGRLHAPPLEKTAVRSLLCMKQIHSSLIHRVDAAACSTGAPLRGDGFTTDEPGVILAIQTADCIPVLIADRKRKAVAAFHAGWRGTVKRIVESGVGRMRLEFGSRPEDLIAAIGPGIGACCYAVGDEVRGEFESQFEYAASLFSEVYDADAVKQKYPMLFLTARAPGHSNLGPAVHLDLVEANRRQLLDAGLKPGAIRVTGECTGCRTDRFFSHRAEQGFTGRMLSAIGVV